MLVCVGYVLIDDVSDSVANHGQHVHIVSGHAAPRANRIIYLNSTQPLKYQNNKIRLEHVVQIQC